MTLDTTKRPGKPKVDYKKHQLAIGVREPAARYRVKVDSRHFRAGEIISPAYVGSTHAIVRRAKTRREIPIDHIEKIEEGIISFRHFLAEMPYYTEVDKDHENNMMSRLVHKDDDKDAPWKKIGEINGHEVHKRTYEKFGAHTYHVINPNTKAVKLALDTEDHKDGEQVTMVAAVNKSPVKAHQLYHHIVTQHGVKLHSDTSQSPGGVHIWKQLHAMPGIKMTHHSNVSGRERELHIGSKWDENYGFNSHFRAEKA